MDYSKLYRTLQTGIRELSDEEVVELLSFIEIEVASRQHMANYDPSKDALLTGEIGFEGSSDLSERIEDILYGEEQPITETNEHKP
jgi:hypothetical protein